MAQANGLTARILSGDQLSFPDSTECEEHSLGCLFSEAT